MTMRARSLAVLSLLLLTGCSATAPQAEVATPTPTASPTPATPAEATATLAERLAAAIPEITQVVVLDETNDPNDLLGRPTGYIAGAVLYDSRASCTELGVACGATIEVWPEDTDAVRRMDYIQGVLEDAPVLGSEYDYIDGNILLRVTGELPPSVASEYEAALK